MMSAKKTAAGRKKATTVVAGDPDDLKGTLKRIGGSRSDHWNNILANQAIEALWLKNSDEKTRNQQISAAVAGLVGISWAVILYKSRELRRAQQDSEAFLEVYHEGSMQDAYEAAKDLDRSPLAAVFLSANGELRTPSSRSPTTGARTPRRARACWSSGSHAFDGCAAAGCCGWR